MAMADERLSSELADAKAKLAAYQHIINELEAGVPGLCLQCNRTLWSNLTSLRSHHLSPVLQNPVMQNVNTSASDRDGNVTANKSSKNAPTSASHSQRNGNSQAGDELSADGKSAQPLPENRLAHGLARPQDAEDPTVQDGDAAAEAASPDGWQEVTGGRKTGRRMPRNFTGNSLNAVRAAISGAAASRADERSPAVRASSSRREDPDAVTRSPSQHGPSELPSPAPPSVPPSRSSVSSAKQPRPAKSPRRDQHEREREGEWKSEARETEGDERAAAPGPSPISNPGNTGYPSAAAEGAGPASGLNPSPNPNPRQGPSRLEMELARVARVRRQTGMVCMERVNGRLVNILEGLELHESVFSPVEQEKLVNFVLEEQDKGRRGLLRGRTYTEPRKWMRGKGRVTIQYGCCYNYAVDRAGNPPGIARAEDVEPLPPLLNTTIRRLVRWRVLPPSQVPDSSVLVLQGNGADVAKHSIPAVPSRRISITFRRMARSKVPQHFEPNQDLENLEPLPEPRHVSLPQSLQPQQPPPAPGAWASPKAAFPKPSSPVTPA
eukprot:jgi/Mesen1/5816/ME000296S05108